ncbi:flagellar hook capping FlgD N-terminal domain-containing protein [Roseateles depolymerans]|uniref:Basal-body rod modification protein FlgD n=1 Tax=Roseateles depolymerans TaxID=76731 RepID=A0A0U2U7I7_9BURK|nr:flagellar hook capping FlgD N-terminal domain-containing protein [Roseateles depolymerans]ALV07969.1 Putative basal-body rod modification protein FlgD [Roseateles depolymerans]REG21812.1 flagellar basal-body rod modification protein FlgD [Roseateles depolymerans]
MSTAVTNTTSSSSSTSGNSIAGNGELSSLFTTLLVAQIKNQDPLSPQDPSQFVSQLTQLSQVESMQQLTSQGQTNTSMLASLQLMTLGAQVGSTLQAAVSSVSLSGQPVELRFNLDSSSTANTLVVTGSDGRAQRVDLGSMSRGEQSYTLDPAKLGLANGSYSVAVETQNKQSVTVETLARLDGVRLSADGNVMLQLAGVGEVTSQAITQFKGRSGN